ncbi:MAG: aspartate 1-decarboxylase [Caldithrix sp.]|nr:aspartate 1-decarboxylase [Caldithrix sp.]
MERIFLNSKIHRAVVTDADLNYEGSLTIDPDLMAAANILPFEKVDVVNINTGDRLSTYAIQGKAGSGDICLNGGAARLGQKGDLIIIISYVHLTPQEVDHHQIKVVLLDGQNKVKTVQNQSIR